MMTGTAGALPRENSSLILSRYVRATLVCRDEQVTAETVTDALIDKIAANVRITGYDTGAVRAHLLDGAR